jgi:putative phage-type endonuclease
MNWYNEKNYKVIDFVQGSDDWHKYRSTRIGASDVPSIVGCTGAYSNFDSVMIEKLTGELKEVSPYMAQIFKRGHEVEELVRSRFFSGFKPIVIESKEDSFMFASLDGINERGEIIEIKSTEAETLILELKHDRIPSVWYYQMQYQMMIAGVQSVMLAVGLPLNSYYFREVERNESSIFEIKKAVSLFKEQYETSSYAFQSVEEELEKLAEIKREVDELSGSLEVKEKEMKRLASMILTQTNMGQVVGSGLKIARIDRKGSVDYSSIPELNGVDLEKYRKESSSYIKVSLK